MSKELKEQKRAKKERAKVERLALEQEMREEKKYIKTLSRKEKKEYYRDKQANPLQESTVVSFIDDSSLIDSSENANTLEGKNRRKKKSNKKSSYNSKGKKKHTCLCCFSSIIISLVLVVGGLFGTSLVLYNKYAQPITQMSLFEAFDVVFNLYSSDKDKIVTNPYDPTVDSEKFYKGLSDSLRIDKILTISDIANGINSKPDGGTDGSGSTGNTFLDQLLADTEFDFSSLVNFDGTMNPGFAVTDKMLAAILDDAFSIASEIEALASLEKTLGMPLTQAFSVDQVIITSDAVKSSFAGVADTSNAKFKITLSMKIRDLMTSMVANMGGVPDFVKNMIPALMPDVIFFSMELTPGTASSPGIQLNHMKPELMSKIIVAMDNVLGLQGGGESADGAGQFTSILNKVGNTVHDLFQKVNNLVGDEGISFASSTDGGIMNIDTLQAMMYAMDVKNVSSTDFLLMVKHLHSVDHSLTPDISITDYVNTMVKEEDRTSIEKYNAEIKEVFSGYGVSNHATADWTPDKFVNNISKLPNLINIVDYVDANGKHLYDYNQSSLSTLAHFSDNALAQILQAQINKPATAGLDFPFKLNILELDMIKSPTFDGFKIIASIDLMSIISSSLEGNPLKTLMSSLFPENLFVEITTPFVRNSDPKKSSSNIIFNFFDAEGNSSQAESDAMLSTLSKIMSTLDSSEVTFDKEVILATFDDKVYTALEQIQNGSSTEKAPITIDLADGGIQLPTVYKILSDMSDNAVATNDMQGVLSSYYNIGGYMTGEGSTTVSNTVAPIDLYGVGNFVERELQEKMFLNTAGHISNSDPTKKNVYDFLTTIGGSLIGTSINDTITVPKFLNNNKPASNNNINIDSLEFAKILLEGDILSSIQSSISIYKDFTISNAFVDASGNMNLTIVGVLNNTTPPSSTGGNISLSQFATPYIFINTCIPLNSTSSTKTSITINDTKDETQMTALLKILGTSSNTDINVNKITANLDEQIKPMLKSFEDQGIKMTSSYSDITDSFNGILGNNIYDMVAFKMKGYSDTEPNRSDENLRSILYKLNHPSEFLTNTGEGKGNVYTDANPPSTPTQTADGIIIDDLLLGHSLAKSISAPDSPDKGKYTLSKLAVFPKGTNPVTGFTKDAYLKECLAFDTYNNIDTLTTTFKIPKKSITSDTNSIINQFLPEFAYLTILMDIKNQDTQRDLTINNLTQAEYDYLILMTTPDTGTSDMATTVDLALTNLFTHTVTLDLGTGYSYKLPLSDVIKGLSNITTDGLVPDGFAYGKLLFKMPTQA